MSPSFIPQCPKHGLCCINLVREWISWLRNPVPVRGWQEQTVSRSYRGCYAEVTS